MFPQLLAYRIFQIAYVTTDIDDAVGVFGERFGVTNWFLIRDRTIDIGGSRTAVIDVALASRGDMQLEIIAPLSGDDQVYRQGFAASADFQLVHHHVAQMVPAIDEFEAARARAIQQGFSLPVDSQDESGTRYFYADTRAILGHHLEFIHYSPEVLAYLGERVPQN